MTVVECPKCSSKFKINKDLLDKERIKMRCSICAHVFTYPLEETSTGSDFDLLIGTSDKELEDKPMQDSLERDLQEGMPGDLSEGITESLEEEKPEEKPEELEASKEVQPESVIREIDSILGAGDEIASREETGLAGIVSKKRLSKKVIIAIAAVILLIAGAGIWFMKDIITSGVHGLGRPDLDRGPFFTIPDSSVTYEILTNSTEGSVLVVKGVIKKLTQKPLKSVMVEARVYDKGNKMIESRSTYAGIVPESSEIQRQKGAEILSILTAEPAKGLGVLETSPDIPFTVAFFGKPARDSYSFQVEVKEFRWK